MLPGLQSSAPPPPRSGLGPCGHIRDPVATSVPAFLTGPHGAARALSAVPTRVHYKADPVDGDRGLCNVGGQDALPYTSWSNIKHLGQGRRSHEELTRPRWTCWLSVLLGIPGILHPRTQTASAPSLAPTSPSVPRLSHPRLSPSAPRPFNILNAP